MTARRLAIICVIPAGLAGCMAPPPPAPPGPAVAPPSALDLMHSKVEAYNAGVAAGKRIQARRDEAALAAAAAQSACPQPPPPTPAPTATAAPAQPPKPPAPVPPPPSPAPVYTQGGPAVPVAPAQ